MERMNVVRGIGSLILALLIVAVPFLCALSYALNWYAETKFIFTSLTVGVVIGGTSLIYETSEE